MATIGATLRIFDGMTGPLRHITNALNIVISTMESVQRTSGDMMNLSALQNAREEISRASIGFEDMERQIAAAGNEQERFNRRIGQGSSNANRLLGSLSRVAAGIGGILGVQKILDISDKVVTVNARLNLLTGGDSEATKQLQSDIYQSAQRARAPYQETADAISKMGIVAGEAFSSNSEIVAFMEQVNKQFAIAGTAPEGMKAAMLQLTQAMGSGVLRGEELNSIFEQAPTMVQSIADYLGVPIGQIRAMASEGQLTSEIVKNALLSTAEETNRKFEDMPKTFAQIWTQISNTALMEFQPVLLKLNEIANSDKFQKFINGAIQGFSLLGSAAAGVLDFLIQGANLIADNWGLIAPVIGTILGAMLLYKGEVLAINAAEGVGTAIKTLNALATVVQATMTRRLSSDTAKAAIAQLGLNAALLACPITQIVMWILVLIGIIYFATAAWNKFNGTAYSGTGILLGILYAAGAIIANLLLSVVNFFIDIFAAIYNVVAAVAEFFANAWEDPIGSVIHLFADLGDFALGIIYSIANAIDTVFGTDFAGVVKGWQDDLQSWANETAGEKKVTFERFDASKYDKTRLGVENSFISGLYQGTQFDDKISDFFNPEDFLPNSDKEPVDHEALLGTSAATAENTAAMKDALDITNEELKYKRDIAEQEAINRFTMAEISVNMSNQNNINSGMDIDGVIDQMFERVNEAVEVVADGVHN